MMVRGGPIQGQIQQGGAGQGGQGQFQGQNQGQQGSYQFQQGQSQGQGQGINPGSPGQGKVYAQGTHQGASSSNLSNSGRGSNSNLRGRGGGLNRSGNNPIPIVRPPSPSSSGINSPQLQPLGNSGNSPIARNKGTAPPNLDLSKIESALEVSPTAQYTPVESKPGYIQLKLSKDAQTTKPQPEAVSYDSPRTQPEVSSTSSVPRRQSGSIPNKSTLVRAASNSGSPRRKQSLSVVTELEGLAGNTMFSLQGISGIVDVIQLLEAEEDADEAPILFLNNDAIVQEQTPKPTGVHDGVFLSLLVSGGLTADLISSLDSDQSYYYAILLLNCAQKNQKDISSSLLGQLHRDRSISFQLYFLSEVTKFYGTNTIPMEVWRSNSQIASTVAWLNEKMNLKTLPKKAQKNGAIWSDVALVDPLANIDKPINEVKLVKIFTSNARPILIEMANTETQQKSTMIFKQGDDLRQDYVVQIMFFLFNRLWQWSDLKNKPFIHQYKIVPMGPSSGVIEFVPGCVSSGAYKWKNLANLQPQDKIKFLCSMAGSYVACWILGIRDRHQDNMMIKDNLVFFHIDFGFILNDAPGFDAPIFSIPRGVKSYLTGGEWRSFVGLCARAFAVLHLHSGVIINCCSLLMSKLPDIALAETRKYLAKSLMVSLTNASAQQAIADLVEKGSSSTQKEVKYLVHSVAQSMKA